MRMWTGRGILRTALGAATVLFVGCGGGGGASAQEFVLDLCMSVSEWANGVQDESADLARAADPGTTPQEGKGLLLDFTSSLVQRTDKLIEDVEAAGVPDVSGGEAAAAQFTDGLRDVRTSFEGFRDQVEALPTDDPAAFGRQTQEISSSIQGELGKIGDRFEQINSPALDEAAAKEPACQSLGA